MSTPEKMMNCPSEETLAAFIDGRLGVEARRSVVEHVAVCADCHALISATWDSQALQSADAETRVVRPRFGRGWWVAAAAAAAIALIFFLPGTQDWIAFQRSGGMTEVVAAYGDLNERPVESRFSGGFPHKMLERRLRGDESKEVPSDLETLRLLEAARRLEGKESWKALRASAIALALLGYRNDAVQRIDDAVARRGTDDPVLLNDRAAIYIETARTREEIDRAVAAAERAWTLAQTPESAWNRALAYDRAERRADALRAWNDYLKLESTGAWAAEAQDKVSMLKDELPAR